jgi:IS5 family transposase
MLIIAYPPDEPFLQNGLVEIAQRCPKYRQLHEVLQRVFNDPAVQLAMRHDLAPPGSQASWNGCPALPLVVTGCLAVVRRLMGWSYRVLAEEVNVSAGWRWVCQLYAQPMPNFRTIRDREALLKPKTLRLMNARVIEMGRALGITTGQRLRLDSSVIETDIHYPTDSWLLDDAARVISRLVRQARDRLRPRARADKVWFRDRHRQAHRLARQIAELSRKNAKNTGKSSLKWYAQLLGLVETLRAQVAHLQPRLAGLSDAAAAGLNEMFDHYLPLVQRVLDQTRRRVLQGEAVPASDKVVSLFEPHTDIICRGKTKPKDTEFGHKVWYAEVDGGLISEYRLLKGNPSDENYVLPSVQHHRRLFGRAPEELSGDRGLHSPANERQARALGVRRVCLPQRGYKSARRRRYEQQPWFRAARRFRNGIEGRISQVRRARHLDRCLNHGWDGLERWVGWGVIANNIAVIVMKLNKRRRSLAQALA